MAKIRQTKKGKIKVREGDIEKALHKTKTQRKKKTIRLYVLFVIMILTFVVMKYWESSAKQEIREMARDMKPTIRVDETDTNIDTANNDTISEVLDKGTPCRDHEYILSAGTSESLRFDIKLEREVIQLAHLFKNNIESGDITVESSFDKWEEKGITASILSYEMERLNGKTNVWAVQAGELLAELKKNGEPAVNSAKSFYGRINGYIAKKTRYTVSFFNEGSGVISTLGRYYYSEAKVGELVEKDITEKLGGALKLAYVHEGKNYQLPVEKKEVEKTVYFINFIININLPDLPVGDAGDIYRIGSIKSNFIVKVKDAPEMNFDLKLSYNAKNNEFHVFGPALSAKCYKTVKAR